MMLKKLQEQPQACLAELLTLIAKSFVLRFSEGRIFNVEGVAE